MELVKYNNRSILNVTALDSLSSGSLVLLNTNTISSASSSSFTSNINSTYDTYLFEFINLHPASNNVDFQVNFRDGGSDYDATKTMTQFLCNHTEAGGGNSLSGNTSKILAQSTNYASLNENTYGTDADSSLSGYMYLFSPSSTVFLKHFLARVNSIAHSDGSNNQYIGGYFNSTSAIDAINFKFSSGTIDSGNIKLYGLKDS